MHTVAVINQKGGVGKTTLASTLAVLAHMDGHMTAVLDTDQSASLANWHHDREKIAGKAEPRLLVANDEEDPERVRRAAAAADRAGVEWLFIDTGAGLKKLHVVAAELADIVVIPCTPSKRDQVGTAPTVQLVKRLRKTAYVVVNKGSSSKAINDATAIGLSSAFGLPTISTHIVRRQPTTDTEHTGETLPEMKDMKDKSVLNGQSEFRALWDWLRANLEAESGAEGEGDLPNVQEG